MTLLEAKGLTVSLGGRPVVDAVTFALEENQFAMLVGPNGAGKSTLLSALTRGLPFGGEVRFLGENIVKLSPKALARGMGVLRQSHAVTYAFTVQEVVALGRYAHSGGFWGGPGPEDTRMVEEALEQTGLTAMRGRDVCTLSGGELQRVFLAQVLAQDPRVLLLDEPTNALDPPFQKQLFELIARWVARPGRAALAVEHDLSLALAYGSHALLLKEGRLVAQGEAAQTLTAARLREVYGMDVVGWLRGQFARWESIQNP